jgi:hypothetical protein
VITEVDGKLQKLAGSRNVGDRNDRPNAHVEFLDVTNRDCRLDGCRCELAHHGCTFSPRRPGGSRAQRGAQLKSRRMAEGLRSMAANQNTFV